MQREPFVESSIKAVNVIGEEVTGYVNVLTLVNSFYYARKETGIEKAREFISDILNYFEVVNTSKQVCINALHSDFKDFEDAIQEYSAISSDIEIVVTRNVKDFKNSQLQIFEPEEFINRINKQ